MQSLLSHWLRPIGVLMLLLIASTAWGQQITGTVTDGDSGETLIGVNVIVKGTTSGTTTDLDGNFALTASASDVLIFSYTGYTTQEIAVGGQSTINLVLAPDAETLDEVVVVGYGREKKSTLTGSVSAINSEQLTAVPVANASNLLSGRVPGVMTRQNSGLPGGENTQIRIRGFA
ncbi:MAG: carboxypeptidase-like regulatory domain-containing protein, partial [Bacteroidota bacterium]